MPELHLSFDPLNPGQFFACCGLQQLFDLQGIATLSSFAFDFRRPRQANFILLSPNTPFDLPALFAQLKSGAFAVSSDHPDKGLAPAQVTISQHRLPLDWWLDWFHEGKTALKGWAGQLSPLKLFTELPRLLPDSPAFINYAANTKTKFGLDPRSAWEARDIGFSPNEHNGADVYPAVELLAAIGLQTVRPVPRPSDEGRSFRYSLWADPLPLCLARSCPWPGLLAHSFDFRVNSRGSYAYFSFATPVTERNNHA
jgi:CRISPR-associated protein Csx14